MQYLQHINSPEDLKHLTAEQLVELAAEIRQEIVGSVSTTGGHLGSNLGSVELAVALHYVFDTPGDRIIWDVSHQSYPHKILTGRREQMHTLRQFNGIAGYCKRTESAHDHFGAGHASTSISAALGFAAARDVMGRDNKVIAVIGDGAMTGGLAFEGMNNAGSAKKNLMVILNDNTWSISKNVGAISKYLTTMMADEKFNKLRNEVWELTGRFKRRETIRSTIQRLEKSIKSLLVPGMLFEKLGFRYFGPIDGHDLPLMIKTLRDLKSLQGPVLLHVGTMKGKGYQPAEEDAHKLHGVGKFDKITGKAAPKSPGLPPYTNVFGKTMIELAEKNDKVIAITAAMATGTGLEVYGEKFPDRFFDVGIAEAHAACFSAGLSCEGARPYLAVYSTFMQRAYDQVIHDMAIQNLPVTICMDRAGLVGNDGPTHHGVFDIAYMSVVPNLTLCAPKDGNELRSMLHHTADNQLDGIVAIRYPRDAVPRQMEETVAPIEWGRWEWLTEQHDAVLLAVGSMVTAGLRAAEILASQGHKLAVVNARFIKPMDEAVLEHVLKNARFVFTAEEGQLRGGFGQAVAAYLMDNAYEGRFKSFGISDNFTTHGDRNELLELVGLDAESIAGSIEDVLLNRSSTRRPNGILQKLGLRRNSGTKRKNGEKTVRLTGTE